MSSIAIIQTAFIGDVILATPLLEAARKSRPDDRIITVVRAGCDNLLINNPNVDEVIVWDKHGNDNGVSGLLRFSRRLKKISIHTALIPHRSLRSASMAFMAGIHNRIGFAKGGGRLLHTVRIPYRTGIHEVERNLMLADAADMKSNGCKPAIFPDDMDRQIVDDCIRELEPYCVLAPGSVWATKRWPVESYVEAGSSLVAKGMNIVISGGPDDAHVCAAVAAGIPGSVDTCGLLTLRQSAELYRRSRFVITGDTAPQHLAAAVGTWVFALFGPTVRDFGFWPYSKSSMVIEEDADCRPCGIHGHKACPEGTHRCMLSITPDRVIRAIENVLDIS